MALCQRVNVSTCQRGRHDAHLDVPMHVSHTPDPHATDKRQQKKTPAGKRLDSCVVTF